MRIGHIKIGVVVFSALGLAGVESASNLVRRVYRLIELTIDKHGNTLLLPEVCAGGVDDNTAREIYPLK